ncbi:MAG: hypothetical protein WC141_08650 [Arcobacteraceae bacterium]
MKTFLKRAFYTFFISLIFLALLSFYFSKKLVQELESMHEIYYENSYLTDAAAICMQLYFINPTVENKKTCIQIEETIRNNKNELKSFTFAFIYFEYLEKKN